MRLRLLPLVALLAAGCSGTPGTVSVRGVVTVDGRPAPDGSVRFTPSDGQGPSQAAFLRDGRFETELRPAQYQVRISIPVEGKAAKPADTAAGAGEPPVGELLPPRYNVKTELSLTVTGPSNDTRFELQSK
jgi:hypothetical protein